MVRPTLQMCVYEDVYVNDFDVMSCLNVVNQPISVFSVILRDHACHLRAVDGKTHDLCVFVFCICFIHAMWGGMLVIRTGNQTTKFHSLMLLFRRQLQHNITSADSTQVDTHIYVVTFDGFKLSDLPILFFGNN